MKELSQALPEVEIQFRGQTHKVKCSFGVLARFEKLSGHNPFDPTLWVAPSALTLLALFVAALRKDYPDLKIEDVQDELSLQDIMQVREVIAAMMGSAVRAGDKKKPEEELPRAEPKANNQAGSNS